MFRLSSKQLDFQLKYLVNLKVYFQETLSAQLPSCGGDLQECRAPEPPAQRAQRPGGCCHCYHCCHCCHCFCSQVMFIRELGRRLGWFGEDQGVYLGATSLQLSLRCSA